MPESGVLGISSGAAMPIWWRRPIRSGILEAVITNGEHVVSVTQQRVAQHYTVEQLMREFSREEVLDIWKTLPAPEPEELDGEYAGHVHDGGDLELRKLRNAFFYDEESDLGSWVGKAYAPKADGMGEGYNSWRRPGGIVNRYLRFATEIGPSHLDGRPSLIMHYARFDNYSGSMDLIDEIRRLDVGAYLGIYTATEAVPGFSIIKPGNTRSEPDLFGLTGPIGPWVGVDDPELEAR